MTRKPPKICSDCRGRIKWSSLLHQPGMGYFHLGVCSKCGTTQYFPVIKIEDETVPSAWRDWNWIACAIAAGAKEKEIGDYIRKTECRYCVTILQGNDHAECPLYSPDHDTVGCAGGHYAVVHAWTSGGRYGRKRPTRAEALRSARVIAEITGGD